MNTAGSATLPVGIVIPGETALARAEKLPDIIAARLDEMGVEWRHWDKTGGRHSLELLTEMFENVSIVWELEKGNDDPITADIACITIVQEPKVGRKPRSLRLYREIPRFGRPHAVYPTNMSGDLKTYVRTYESASTAALRELKKLLGVDEVRSANGDGPWIRRYRILDHTPKPEEFPVTDSTEFPGLMIKYRIHPFVCEVTDTVANESSVRSLLCRRRLLFKWT